MANRKLYRDEKADFFTSPEAEDLYDDFKSIFRKVDEATDDYYDFIDDLVERNLIDERLRDRILGLTADMDSVESWFDYNLREYSR